MLLLSHSQEKEIGNHMMGSARLSYIFVLHLLFFVDLMPSVFQIFVIYQAPPILLLLTPFIFLIKKISKTKKTLQKTLSLTSAKFQGNLTVIFNGRSVIYRTMPYR